MNDFHRWSDLPLKIAIPQARIRAWWDRAVRGLRSAPLRTAPLKTAVMVLAALALVGLSLLPAARALAQAEPMWVGYEVLRAGLTSKTPPALPNQSSVLKPVTQVDDTKGDQFLYLPRGRDGVIEGASLLLLERSGATLNPLLLELEVYSASGVYLRTLTAAPLDLSSASTGEWVDLPVNSPAEVASGELLALHFKSSGALIDSTVTTQAVEVRVAHPIYALYQTMFAYISRSNP